MESFIAVAISVILTSYTNVLTNLLKTVTTSYLYTYTVTHIHPFGDLRNNNRNIILTFITDIVKRRAMKCVKPHTAHSTFHSCLTKVHHY